MKVVLILTGICVVGLVAATQYLARQVVERFPPKGQFAEIDGARLHFTDYAADGQSDLPPLVFIHGASGNLREQEGAFLDRLKGTRRLIFVDRPGHGFSERGTASDIHLPVGQARMVAGLLETLEIETAIFVGHSFGGSVVASIAVEYPEKTAGLVFLAPATHPWPGGGITWHYDVTSTPVVGWLFSELIAVPGGHLRYEEGVQGVFKPEKIPAQYEEKTGTKLLFRPSTFRWNAEDVSSLFAFVRDYHPRYSAISVPTMVVTGDSDDVVLADIHSVGLERDIDGAQLIWLEGAGHAPHWTRLSEVIDAIDAVSMAARSTDFAAAKNAPTTQ